MAFEDIEFVGKPPAIKPPAVPDAGVRVIASKIGQKGVSGKGQFVRFVRIEVSKGLAAACGLEQPAHFVRLAFGTDQDAGLVRVLLDGNGGFVARYLKRQKCYGITLSAATCEGLFATDFPTFTIDPCRLVVPAEAALGFEFRASEQMLAAD
jgi:hypothetical protein